MIRYNLFYLSLFLPFAFLLYACAPAATVTSPAPTVPPLATSTPGISSVPPLPTVANIDAGLTPVLTPTETFGGDPVKGQKVFASQPCGSCHDITHPFPGGFICPNLGNISEEAARIVRSPGYTGKAIDAAGYIRESIVDPNAYIVPGKQFRQPNGESLMPKIFAQVLTPAELDDLVAFLMRQNNGRLPSER